jgi:hypothetical protein
MKSRIRSSKSCTFVLFFTMFLCAHASVRGQISGSMLIGASLNGIPTSVPFLTIAPDGRSSGMGDGGVASITDVNSQHWNAAKYAFADSKKGVALSYIPWITNLIPDVNHLYLSGFYKIDPKNTLSTSFRYFSLGTIAFAGGGTAGTQYHPKEFAVDAGYSRRFTDHFSGGVVLRYIHSDLTDGRTTSSGQDTQVGTSFAGDLGLYYQKNIQLGEKDAQWALGLDISNIGSPISYSKDAEATPIPTNLRMGGRFTYNINELHSLSIHADLNKLLVPTPPYYESDSATGELSIIRGKEAPESVIRGMFQSFYDAPGVLRENGSYSVIAEEFHEISFALGAEYWYRKLVAFRTGYFHEHPAKGNRKYFTFGLGARYRFVSFDLSYLLPLEGQNSPLYNTFRLSLALIP